MKIKCSKTNSMISIFLSNKNFKHKKIKIMNLRVRFKNGKVGIRLVKRAKARNYRI
jgi:hypothetical protein